MKLIRLALILAAAGCALYGAPGPSNHDARSECPWMDSGDNGTAPSGGAFATGRYRNLFEEAGHTREEVRKKIDALGIEYLYLQFISVTGRICGKGIPAENLTRIFSHGFTTRKDGHGFGLHSGALAAREMGGALTVHSDGPGCGATFTLELPAISQEAKPSASSPRTAS